MHHFKSLFELFNEELLKFTYTESYKYKSIEEFITDDKKSAQFINCLNYGDKNLLDDIRDYPISQGRARHSVISFFLGLVLGKFKKLLGNCTSVLNDDNAEYLSINEPYLIYKLWMITAINHDYGYHSNRILNKISLESLDIKYDLFDDQQDFGYYPLINYSSKYPKVLLNDYEQIKNYYKYSQIYHELKGDEEKNDHGILGATLLYDKVIRKNINTLKDYESNMNNFADDFGFKDILFYKTACLTIAQHNIYKSDKPEMDSLYGPNLEHLHYGSGYSVDEKYVLLYLLSLVDTVECVKLFSRSEGNSRHFETLTVLKNILVSVSEDEILIDFTKLYDKIQNEKIELLNILNKHMSNIMDLKNWTSFNVQDITPALVKIF